MSSMSPEKHRVGLCVSCLHVRLVRTDRGTVFYQCQRSITDPTYPKYPRLPVVQCPGHELKSEDSTESLD